MKQSNQYLKLQHHIIMRIVMHILGVALMLSCICIVIINKGYYSGCLIGLICGMYIIICAHRYIEVKTDKITYRNFFKTKVVYFKDIKEIQYTLFESYDYDTGAIFHGTTHTVRDKNDKKLFELSFGDVNQFITIAKRRGVPIKGVTK